MNGETAQEHIERVRRERRAKAYKLRQQGMPYRDIGKILGISHAQVSYDVMAYEETLTTDLTPPPSKPQPPGRPLTSEEWSEPAGRDELTQAMIEGPRF